MSGGSRLGEKGRYVTPKHSFRKRKPYLNHRTNINRASSYRKPNIRAGQKKSPEKAQTPFTGPFGRAAGFGKRGMDREKANVEGTEGIRAEKKPPQGIAGTNLVIKYHVEISGEELRTPCELPFG